MTAHYRPEIIQSAFVNFVSARLLPFWSLTTPKLRLVARHALSDELIALQFEVNRAFKQRTFEVKDEHNGWQGGQYINLTIPIDGIYHQRSYSLVGLPKQELWWGKNDKMSKQSSNRQTLTIAIKPQGTVSDYLTKHAAIGTIFDSSMPSGDFTLQQTVIKNKETKNLSCNEQTPLLFVAGGSGITPMLGLITQALQDKRQVTLLHYNRGAVLENYWQSLANEHASFSYHLIDTQNSDSYLAGSRHLNDKSLLTLDLPLQKTQIFACGSQALLASLYKAVDEIDAGSLDNFNASKKSSLRDNIIIERFGTALPEQTLAALDKQFDLATHTVYLRSRQQQFNSDSTLLLSAEQAGIRLNFGCRQGICQLCRCNKVSGVVKNIQTGKLSSDGYDSIQTCINVAMSDVVLDI